jgi:hypothetical protein
MKKLLILVFLMLFGSAVSQESLFDEEWHQGLGSDLEYICYPSYTNDTLSVRVYRGTSEQHLMTIKNEVGTVVYTQVFSREEDLDLSKLCSGVYVLTVSNDKTNQSQVIFVSIN